jgi:hypothetical protein
MYSDNLLLQPLPTHRMTSNAAAYFRFLFPFSLVNVSFSFLAVKLLYTRITVRASALAALVSLTQPFSRRSASAPPCRRYWIILLYPANAP